MTYKILNAASTFPKNDRRAIIRRFPLWLRINAPKLKLCPHLFQQLVNIPAMLGTDWARVGNPVYEIKLLDRDGVYFVKSIYHRNITSTLCLQDINQVVDRCIAPDSDVGRRNLVLAHDRLDLLPNSVSLAISSRRRSNLVTDVRQWDSVGYCNATLVFLFEDNVRRLFVDSNAETFELVLDDLFVRKGLVDIEDDEDKMASLSNSNDLSTSTFAILGSLDDTWQIEHLNSSAIIQDLAGYRGQGSEFISSN